MTLREFSMSISDRNHSRILSAQVLRVSGQEPLPVVFWGILVAAFLVGFAVFGSDGSSMDEATRYEQLQIVRQKQIPLLEQFLERHPEAPQRFDMMLRLGENRFEIGKYYLSKGARQRGNEEIQKSQVILEQLRRAAPHFQRLDEALFVLANTYLEVQQMDKVGEVLSEIADKFPRSPIIKQTALLLADHYFEKNQFARAENLYQQALDNPKVISYVNYKLAWVSINQNQPGRALKYFEKVLSLRSSPADNSYDYSLDAAKEMVWPALEVYSQKRVLSYLTSIYPDAELLKTALSSLGKGLMQKSVYPLASQVYGELRKRFPNAEEIEEWASQQIKAEEELGNAKQVAHLIGELAGTAANSSKVQSQVLSTAKKYHSEAQKVSASSEKNKLYDLAITYYRSFLQMSPAENIAIQTRFYLGEALFARNRFQEAAEEYKIVSLVENDLRAKAGWSWFLSAERIATGFAHKGKDFRQTSAGDEIYLEAARQIQNIDGISLAQKRKASYQSARLLYQLNDFDRALPVFQYLADKFAKSEEGRLSAQLVLDIYNLKKDYDNVARYARAYQAHVDSGTKSDLSLLEQTALLKSIEEQDRVARTKTGEEKVDALAEIGDRYFQFAKQYPRSTKVDASLWAAIQTHALVAVERHDLEIQRLREAFNLLVQDYSKSPYRSRAIEAMGSFLAYQNVNPGVLKDFVPYKDLWKKQMRAEDKSKRGAIGMLVYRLSSETEQRALMKEFASLPHTEDNREANAYGQMHSVLQAQESLTKVKLNSLKTLAANTKLKLDLLDKLQKEVTDLVKLKSPDLAVKGLRILGDGYFHVAEAIRKAPIPKEIKGEDLKVYQSAVDEKASGFDQKGQEARRLAEEKAREFNISS